MPAASERLLGERLRLPSVATWWCGEQLGARLRGREHRELGGQADVPEPEFRRAVRTGSRCRRRAPPWSSASWPGPMPTWRRSAWRSRRRPYGAAAARRASRRGRSAYASMRSPLPAAIKSCREGSRASQPDAADIVSMQRGGGSKDVWVLAPDRRSIDEGCGSGAAPRPAARHDDLPSRLAENLFWLGRYSERCEDKARLLRATLNVRTNPLLWPEARGTCRHFTGVPKPGDASLVLFDEGNGAGPGRRCAAPGLVRGAGPQPVVGRELARHRRSAARIPGGRRARARCPRDSGCDAALAGRSGRLRPGRHDAGRGLAPDDARAGAWSDCSSWPSCSGSD